MNRRNTPMILTLAILVTIAASCTNNNLSATDLTSGISANTSVDQALDAPFISSAMDFSFRLFQETAADKNNSLISPVSVLLTLAMTANGADQNTLAQMERLLGGDIPLADLNRYLYSYVKNLPNEEKAKLYIANSIWLRDDDNLLRVNQDFLQSNADFYSAKVFKAAFDHQTVSEINQWVKTSTDGMIDAIIDQIDKNAMIFLINAVAFNAEWNTPYKEADVRKDDFTGSHGGKQSVDFMYSDESIYLEDSQATGFVKPYFDSKYSFVALLPNEDVAIKDYAASLSGQDFAHILKNAQNLGVSASIPKFTYDYSIRMDDALRDLGMTDAFNRDKADFGKMAASPENLFIGEVLHKTFIAVNEQGTKAGAVTKAEISTTSVFIPDKQVHLNRPFVYAIIDNGTNLPVFLGVFTDIT